MSVGRAQVTVGKKIIEYSMTMSEKRMGLEKNSNRMLLAALNFRADVGETRPQVLTDATRRDTDDVVLPRYCSCKHDPSTHHDSATSLKSHRRTCKCRNTSRVYNTVQKDMFVIPRQVKYLSLAAFGPPDNMNGERCSC